MVETMEVKDDATIFGLSGLKGWERKEWEGTNLRGGIGDRSAVQGQGQAGDVNRSCRHTAGTASRETG